MMRILVTLTFLALAGCVQSPVPLESGGKLSAPELKGHWKFDFDGEPGVATISQDASGKLKADVVAYWEPGPKIATKQFEIVLARFGKDRYMSLRDVEVSPLYFLARYEVDNKDRFTMYGVGSEQLVEALEQKGIPGEIEKDRHMSMVKLNASSEQLGAYFREHGASAFHEPAQMVFERVASAELPPLRPEEERFAPTPARP